jgi:transcriptional regulator with XRE-family HTH domain
VKSDVQHRKRSKVFDKRLVRLGVRIRKLREAAGFSQENFAFHVGLHPNYLGGIERAERNVAFLNLMKIADGFSISVSELLDLEGPVPQSVLELGDKKRRKVSGRK